VKVSKFSANESINEAERYADYWIFGGIFRPVYLEVLPEVYFERLSLNARANGEVDIHAFLNQESSSNTIEVTLLDKNGNAIDGTESFSLDDNLTEHPFQTRYHDIDPWNPQSPHLYTLRLDLLRYGGILLTWREKIRLRP